MSNLDLSEHSLERRFQYIIRELGRIPEQRELEEVPYFKKVLAAIEAVHGSYDTFISQTTTLRETTVPFPSPEQLHTMAVIGEYERVIIGDEPGTRKTAAAGLAKYVLEQKIGTKVKTVVACPGYLINNWINKLEEYHAEEPVFCVLTSEDKWEDLKRAAQPDVDYIFVSYDLLYKDLEIDEETWDVAAAVLMEQYKGKQHIAFEHYKQIGNNFGLHAESSLEDICYAIVGSEIEQNRGGTTVVDQLIEIMTNGAKDETTRHPFYLIADEFHNVRDISLKKKTNAFYRLGLRARFAAFLSGTKTPDNLSNIAVVASIIDNERYPEPKHFLEAFGRNPLAIRRFYAAYEKKPVVKTRDIIGEDVPEPINIQFSLTEQEKEVYLKIQNHPELTEAEKLLLLRYVVIDPLLIKPDQYTGSTRLQKRLEEIFQKDRFTTGDYDATRPSSRFLAIDACLEHIPAGDKAIIFTRYSTGVMSRFRELFRDRHAVFVDQSVSSDTRKIHLSSAEIQQLKKHDSYRGQKWRVDLQRNERALLSLLGKRTMHYSERDKAVLTFQCDPEIKYIIATYGTLREGRDLHAGNHVLQFDREYQPGLERQAIGRSIGRSGQTKKCTLYQLRAERTVDDGIARHIARKKELIELVEEGESITITDAQTLAGKLRIHREKELQLYISYSSEQIVRMLLGGISGVGVEAMEELVRHGFGGFFADNFNYKWEYSYSANIARLIASLIPQQNKYAEIVELGSGPAQMARMLRRQTTCVDYLAEQLKYGKRACADLGFDIKTHQGSIHNMPFLDDENYDGVIASNVLDLLNLQQRALAVREITRITKQDGDMYIVLPARSLELQQQSHFRKFTDDIGLAGFTVDRERTGKYIVTHAIDSQTQQEVKSPLTSFVIVGKKQREPIIKEGMFELHVDYSYTKGETKRKIKEESVVPPQITPAHLCLSFRNVDTGLEITVGTEGDTIESRLHNIMYDALETGKIREEDIKRMIKNIVEA